LLLQVLYSVRSERMLMEQLDYNLLFRWFVGLSMDDSIWDATVFTKNRERLLAAVGSHQNLQYVAFPPGLATLPPAATSQLSIVAKAMQSRPGLRLTMCGRVEPNVDRPGLRVAMVDQLVKMRKVTRSSLNGHDRSTMGVAYVRLPLRGRGAPVC
jgi:hypothetical protein